MATFEDVKRLAGTEQGLCVAAVTRSDGSVHASVVNAGPMAHPVGGHNVVALVVRADAVKLGRFVSVGRASLTFRRGWRWVGVEGQADIIGPDAPADGVDLPELIREVFKAAGRLGRVRQGDGSRRPHRRLRRARANIRSGLGF